jgi:dienelactone hydrolase
MLFVLAAAPGALRSQQHVRLPAVNGDSLDADLYGSGSRAVVVAHGGRYDRGSWRPQAEALAKAGFRVLAFDFRASVEARAGRETACLYDAACLAADVLSAVRYLRQSGAAEVSVVGASLGGGAAAQASADAAPGEIDRIVLLAHMPVDAPERMHGRKLFIVARDDSGSGGRPRLPAIRRQYEQAPPPKSLEVLDGTAHAQAIFATEEGERLMLAILAFLTEP